MSTTNRYVQRLADGRWIVATRSWQAGEYVAPMTIPERKLTGCHTWVARSLDNLGGGYIYRRRADALRRARQLYS